MSAGDAPSALVCRAVSKRFGSLLANDGIDFDVRTGEVHALVGENGAGKSTLMSICYGLLKPDAGSIEVEGRTVAFASCADAIAAGIGMVFQHYLLVERFSVAENVLLGREIATRGLLERNKAIAAVQHVADRYQFPLDVRAPVESLGIGARQQVELLKVLEREPKIIILDEPTAALSPLEIQGLFSVVRRLRAEGRAIVFISHKLSEVMAISDRISVLRRGKIAGRLSAADATEGRLAELMVGAEAGIASSGVPVAPSVQTDRPVLQTSRLTVLSDAGTVAVDEVSLSVAAGEIVGIAGVEGNGQLEFAEALYGLRAARSGSVLFEGEDVTARGSLQRRSAGMRYVPLDRQREGLVLDFDAEENTLLADQRRLRSGLRIDRGAARQRAAAIAHDYRIRHYRAQQPVRQYSGGTQQKLVIGRELGGEPRLVVAAAPTRGVDIGAAELIYRRLRELALRGGCVVLISYDLDEIRALSHRVAVFFRGRIVGELPVEAASDAALGHLMGGVAIPA